MLTATIIHGCWLTLSRFHSHSVGKMTMQGHDSTLPVTVDDIIYHTK